MGGRLNPADLVFAARPLLHVPVWSIYLVSLHYHHALSHESFGWSNLLMLVCLSLMAAGAYYLNQVYDYESDLMNAKLGFLQRGLVNRAQLTAGFLMASVVAMALTPVFSVVIFMIFVQGLFLAIAYSAPPLRLKDRPFWGLFANAWSIGLLTPFCVMPNITIDNAGLLGWDNPFYFLFTVASITALTTIPDRAGDALAGKKTIAVLLGRGGAMIVALGCAVMSAFIAYRDGYTILAGLSLLAAVLIGAALVHRADKYVLLATKAPILMLTILAGFFYPPYLLFIIVLVVGTRIYYRRRFNIVYPSLV